MRLPPILIVLLLGGIAAAVTQVAMSVPMAAAAMAYTVGYSAIAWRWPHVALAMIFALAPFQSDLSGGGPVRFSIAEINLALTLPVFVLRRLLSRQGIPVIPVALPIALYFGVCIYASLHNWRPTSMVCLIQMFLYLVAATTVFGCFCRRPQDLLLSLNALAFIGAGLALLTMAAPNVLKLNKNGVGASLACAVVVCVELWFAAPDARRKRTVAVAILCVTAGLIFSLSRGSWMAALTGLVLIAALRRQFALLARMALLIVPAIAIFWSLLPAESREYATGFSKDRYNIQMRYESLETAGRLYRANPWSGVGVGLRKEYDATNIVMLTLAETGIPGLITFLLIYVGVVILVLRTQARFSRKDPLYSLVALGGALAVGRLAHGLVDHYWSRGAIMIAWASVGMAIAAYRAAGLRRPAALTVASPARQPGRGKSVVASRGRARTPRWGPA